MASNTYIKEEKISGRYITLEHILPILHSYTSIFKISIIGTSENGVEIPMVTLGKGQKKILVWSQMHGNESTTTKAVMDFMALMAQKESFQDEVTCFLNTYTLSVIPILNPDGASVYTRVNANGIDLNRDAQALTQKESKALRSVYDKIQPDLCLNMHDQRTIYGLDSGKSATVSFLAPAADVERSVNNTRKVAMYQINKMFYKLSESIPGQIGKYDDSFNINCVGDTFTHRGTPTILFEAGHYKKDYERETTRELIYKALLALFDVFSNDNHVSEVKNETIVNTYKAIPENQKSFCDIVLRDVKLVERTTTTDIAIQYEEVLENGKITFVPTLLEFDTKLKGHKELIFNGATVEFNERENVLLNEKLTKVYNKTNKVLISLRIT